MEGWGRGRSSDHFTVCHVVISNTSLSIRAGRELMKVPVRGSMLVIATAVTRFSLSLTIRKVKKPRIGKLPSTLINCTEPQFFSMAFKPHPSAFSPDEKIPGQCASLPLSASGCRTTRGKFQVEGRVG